MPRTVGWDPPRTPFTLSDVAPLGVTRNVVRSALASGRVVPLARGVFIAAVALAGDPAGLHVQRAIAQQRRRPTAIASHRTAALAWGLALDQPAEAADAASCFIVPERPEVRSRSGEGFAIAVRDLPAEHRVAHPSGLLVTSLARTAVDVAAVEPSLPAALVVVDATARRLLIDAVGERRARTHYTRPQSLAAAVRPLREAAEHAATQFTRQRLQMVIDLADARRESPLESFSFGQMVLYGLPLPQLQVRIRTPEGDMYPDFLWEEAMVIGEADGMSKYRTPEDLRAEKWRQEVLERLGYRVVRWADRDIRRHPAQVMGRVAAAIEARSSS
jgi:very-short-patch-repair endonuclease